MPIVTNTIHLFRSQTRAECFSKKLAGSGAYLGNKCTTPTSFILDLSKTLNTKLTPIDSMQRQAHLLSVVSTIKSDEAYDYYSKPANLVFLQHFVSRVAGTKKFSEALKRISSGSNDFSTLEKQAFLIASEYFNELLAFNIAEVGTLASMVSCAYKNKFEVYFQEEIDCEQAVLDCIKTISVNDVCLPHVSQKPLNNDMDRTFSLWELSETKAKIPALEKMLTESTLDSSIAIVSNCVDEDADIIMSLCDNLNKDVKLNFNKTVRATDTHFGSALLACYKIQNADPDKLETYLSDFLHNPLSDVSFYKCLELEKDMRLNPNTARLHVEEWLESSSATFSFFIQLSSMPFSEPKNNVFDGLRASISNNANLNVVQKTENLAILQAFWQYFDTLAKIGYADDFDFELFSSMNISYPVTLGNVDSSFQILVLQSKTLSKLAESQFDKVVFLDVTTKTFNASTRFDALRTTFDKIGIDANYTASEGARRNFVSGILSSKNDVVFCLPKRDLRNSDVLSPSFVLQEFIMDRFGSDFDLSQIERFVSSKFCNHEVFGEDDLPLIGNYEVKETSDLPEREINPCVFELKSSKPISNYLKKTSNGKDVVMSPSDIETYCQCPYKWFYERRIAHKTLDYEYNQIEKGKLAHRAFKLFYDDLYSKGVYRLKNEEDLEKRKDDFARVFDKSHEDLLCEIDKNNQRRSKVIGVLDSFDIMQTMSACLASLSFQSMIPINYVVAESEMKIDQEQNIKYAGVVINGTIDRVDVSRETDSFIIVDYKGNIKNHGCGFKANDILTTSIEDLALPQKIQTLIYGSCLMKKTNKRCDATLYFSYKIPSINVPIITGAIGEDVIGQFEIIPMKKNECVVEMDMSQYLNSVERRVKQKIDNLLDGDIYPNPASKKVCEYCGVLGCPMRGHVKQ